MKFLNEIEIARPPQELFAALTDLERVAPCLPGASVEGRDGDEYQGQMSVRVGPVNAIYRGHLRFVELDREGRRAVIQVRAEEINGQGSAEARITTGVDRADGGSRVSVETDLQLHGRIAQFGRGAMPTIAARILTEFAANLEALLAPDAVGAQSDVARPGSSSEPATLDMGALLLGFGLRRVVVPGLCAVVGFGYGYLLGRLRKRQR